MSSPFKTMDGGGVIVEEGGVVVEIECMVIEFEIRGVGDSSGDEVIDGREVAVDRGGAGGKGSDDEVFEIEGNIEIRRT